MLMAPVKLDEVACAIGEIRDSQDQGTLDAHRLTSLLYTAGNKRSGLKNGR